MLITQLDIACLSDDAIRRLVATLREDAGGSPPSPRRYADRQAVALVRALNERRRVLAVAELSLLGTEDLEDDVAEADPAPGATSD